MNWILENIQLLVFLFVVISVVRSAFRARKESAEQEANRNESEEQRRVREIQERIRRIAAERRGERPGVEPAAPPTLRPAAPEPAPVPEFDPFGGPVKRALEELERRFQPEVPAPPPPVAVAESRSAELERQERLAEEIRSLEEARITAQRRAAKIVSAQQQMEKSTGGQRTAARGRLMDDLTDPQSLRRAFVLREVLGPPVGLR